MLLQFYAQPGVAPQEVLNRIALPTKNYNFFLLFFTIRILFVGCRAFVEASAVAWHPAFIKCPKIIEILYLFRGGEHKTFYFSRTKQIKVSKYIVLSYLN